MPCGLAMEAIAKGFTPVCAMTPVRRLLCGLLMCAKLWHGSLRDQCHLSASTRCNGRHRECAATSSSIDNRSAQLPRSVVLRRDRPAIGRLFRSLLNSSRMQQHLFRFIHCTRSLHAKYGDLALESLLMQAKLSAQSTNPHSPTIFAF